MRVLHPSTNWENEIHNRSSKSNSVQETKSTSSIMKPQSSRLHQSRCRISAVSFLFLATTTIPSTYTITTTTTTAFVIQQQNQYSTLHKKCIVHMGKNSDRAHIERHLEEMMGDDWREFRARLIARERAEAAAAATESDTSSSTGTSSKSSQQQQNKVLDHSNNSQHPSNNKMLHKQGQLGDLFAGAIHSIFNSHSNTGTNDKNRKVASSSLSKSIFDGDTIGGVSSSSSSSSYKDYAISAMQDSLLSKSSSSLYVEDPFVSAEEVPCHLRPMMTKINKHRWAHDIAHIEAGCVLIANEKLGGVFHQTVVLIVQHNDHVGSIGIVINRYVL
jgi:putative transcriptional regulator